MRLLLDTHAWLWLQTSRTKLDQRILARLRDPGTELLLSAVSSWEIAIKFAQGKLPLPAAPAEYVPDRMRRSGTKALAVTHGHALHVAQLPAHHRDPFDRLLIAQAQLDGLTILTADKVFEQYDVQILWAG